MPQWSLVNHYMNYCLDIKTMSHLADLDDFEIRDLEPTFIWMEHYYETGEHNL